MGSSLRLCADALTGVTLELWKHARTLVRRVVVEGSPALPPLGTTALETRSDNGCAMHACRSQTKA